VSFRALIDWRPDIIITFIDDAYLVRQRVHDGLYTSFTLRELTTWRAEELLAADLLARLVDADEPPPNYVVAVQHSASMLARLLFEPQVAPVYLSHPISEIRNDESAREAIDTFRRTLRGYDKLAVFEPLTIDERPPLLAGSLVTSYDPRNPVHRWPILDATDALSADEDLRARYPLALPKAELLEATDALNEQIPSRDLRLCDQAGALIIYRPTMGGVRGLSGGVRAERDQIRGDGRRPRRIIWYVKKGEDQLPDELFKRPPKPGEDPDFVYEETEERLWEIVRALHESYRPEWQHFLG
jgi:hypothetical protein